MCFPRKSCGEALRARVLRYPHKVSRPFVLAVVRLKLSGYLEMHCEVDQVKAAITGFDRPNPNGRYRELDLSLLIDSN